MNELQIFENADFGSVRTLMINDAPYFVGKDVADILGYQNGSRDINRHVDEDDRRKEMLFDGNQDKETILINESGLYSLILSSKMPNAKKFKHWVTAEVLPSIRKTGGYIVGQEQLTDAELMAKALMVAQKTIEARTEEVKSLKMLNAVQQQQIAELNPKATYYDLVLQCPDLISVTEIAKDYGKSAKWLNKILSENKVQYKQRGVWLLYQKYAEKGYTSTKKEPFIDAKGIQHTKPHTYWTQKGRLFLYEFLKGLGYLPIVEW
ncbi:phage antirepressor KilAC domain-containing protein [Anaerotignum sp.]|uniref:phage antirepressor KilAC domain-containing protein n=1 Tax=Anaerotignum sp. TaxID=2039241 RepID=UPI00399242B7